MFVQLFCWGFWDGGLPLMPVWCCWEVEVKLVGRPSKASSSDSWPLNSEEGGEESSSESETGLA